MAFPSRIQSSFIRIIGDLLAPSGVGEGRLCILNYHRVLETCDPLLDSDPDLKKFRWEMELLANCFNVMPLYDAIQALHSQRMPPRAVAITFDDGYRSTYDLALPILKEFNLPATVFVTTGYIDNDNMWNDKIVEAMRQLPYGHYNFKSSGLGEYSIHSLQDRKHAIQKLTEDAKYFPPLERLKLTQHLEKLVGSSFNKSLMLTREMISALSQQGIEIGGHTVTHPILTSLGDSVARQEIIENKKQLEQITGKPVRLFAYPNGKVGMDFDERHVAMAKEAGFTAAFTTAIGPATKANDTFKLPRCRPWDTSPLMYGIRLLRWLA